MRKRTKIIILIVLLIVIFGGGFYAYAFYIERSPELGLKRQEQACANQTDQKFKEQCLSMLAGLKKDLSICNNQIKDPEQREMCYAHVGGETKDKSICEMINDQWKRNSCYWMAGTRSLNPEFCSLINEPNGYPSQLVTCYEHVASDLKDLKICDQINPPEYKYNCYSMVAIRTNNRSICEQIKSEDDTGSNGGRCLKYFEYKKRHPMKVWFAENWEKFESLIP